MHEVLVNRLGGLSLPRKSVLRLTDRPDMTLDVYRGRKTTMQHISTSCGRLNLDLVTLKSFYALCRAVTILVKDQLSVLHVAQVVLLYYSRLSLSRSRRDPLKHFEISVLRHIRCVILRKKQFEQQSFQITM